MTLYVWGDRSVAVELLGRAQASGFRVLLLTVDVTVRSKRERELRAGLKLPTPNLTLGTTFEAALHPSWWWHFLTSDPPDFPNIDQRDDAGPSRRRDVAELF